jgi:lipopolysaccharide transport system ATP-binding protein
MFTRSNVPSTQTMSDIAIRVEHLSKLYHLGRTQSRAGDSLRSQRHDTPSTRLRTRLRDALASGFSRQSSVVSRQPRLATDNSELKTDNSKLTTDTSLLWALKDVSFDVKQGEVVGTLALAVARRASAGVTGRNGAGKSTLPSAGLKILSHITEPTSGRAEIDHHTPNDLSTGTAI